MEILDSLLTVFGCGTQHLKEQKSIFILNKENATHPTLRAFHQTRIPFRNEQKEEPDPFFRLRLPTERLRF